MAKLWVGLIVLSLPQIGCDFKHQYMYRPSVVERAQARAENEIVLSKDEVTPGKGKVADILVVKNGPVTGIASENPEIATGEKKESTKYELISVTGISPGKTCITVSNQKGTKKKINVEVK
ncbi:MAG TPA: hypothetical protein ACFYED_07570 [Candidatus Tripitaka californicus]|uniref:hypothetical protein n=1 Tax=Candidatus Tripitaka californicus TaxID=3367616 RepID=UPI0040254BE1